MTAAAVAAAVAAARPVAARPPRERPAAEAAAARRSQAAAQEAGPAVGRAAGRAAATPAARAAVTRAAERSGAAGQTTTAATFTGAGRAAGVAATVGCALRRSRMGWPASAATRGETVPPTGLAAGAACTTVGRGRACAAGEGSVRASYTAPLEIATTPATTTDLPRDRRSAAARALDPERCRPRLGAGRPVHEAPEERDDREDRARGGAQRPGLAGRAIGAVRVHRPAVARAQLVPSAPGERPCPLARHPGGHLLAQVLPGLDDQARDVRLGRPELAGDLGERQPAELVPDERDALLLGQPVQPVDELAHAADVRARRPAGWAGRGSRRAPGGAVAVPADVPGDGHEPAAQVERLVAGPQRLVGVEERRLRDILGVVRVPEPGEREAVHVPDMPTVDRLERVVVLERSLTGSRRQRTVPFPPGAAATTPRRS